MVSDSVATMGNGGGDGGPGSDAGGEMVPRTAAIAHQKDGRAFVTDHQRNGRVDGGKGMSPAVSGALLQQQEAKTTSPNDSPKTRSKRRTSAPERQLLPQLKRSESFDFVNEAMLQEMNRDLIDAVRKANQEDEDEGQHVSLARAASLPTSVDDDADGDEIEEKRRKSTVERRKSTGSDA